MAGASGQNEAMPDGVVVGDCLSRKLIALKVERPLGCARWEFKSEIEVGWRSFHGT